MSTILVIVLGKDETEVQFEPGANLGDTLRVVVGGTLPNTVRILGGEEVVADDTVLRREDAGKSVLVAQEAITNGK